jgi:hypothetical protein
MGRWLIRMGAGAYLVATACVSQAPTATSREAKDAPEPSAAVTAAATASAPSPSVSSTSPPIPAGDVAAAPRSEPRAAPPVFADLLREPLFVAAKQKGQDAERIVRPVYRGDRSEKDLAEFLRYGEWAVWRKARTAAIEDAARAYARILERSPAPPSGWVVAVHARVGALWVSFAEEVRDVPVPDNLSGHPNVDYTEQWRIKFGHHGREMQRAAWAFHQCSQAARRAHVADEHARFCEAWLAKHARP